MSEFIEVKRQYSKRLDVVMSTNSPTILMLPGDGIGLEIMAQVERVINWLDRNRVLSINLDQDDIGGRAYERYGSPLDDRTLEKATKSACVLLGAVGGPQYADLPYDKRPEAGLLRLRKEMGLFANLRPVKSFGCLVDASTLKPEVVRGLDILIVRELTGGVYFGTPRGIFDLGNGQKRGVNTHEYVTSEIEQVSRVAFEFARQRKGRVVSVDKSNVMEAGLLWREVAQAVGDSEYPDVTLSHMYADNCAMQLVRNPREFDVILTDNLFGDILSDEGAMLTGSLGMLPSASLGAADSFGQRRAMYEPIHGSAPDIAGRNMANPTAAMLSFCMALRHSLGMEKHAERMEAAIETTLEGGIRTADVMEPGATLTSTEAFTDAVIRELERSFAS